MFSPVAGLLRRIIPPGGSFVSGIYIPEGMIVAVNSYAASHSKSNFYRDSSFIPERWLDSSDVFALACPPEGKMTDFTNDQRQVVQAFSMGPRNCIGQKLAMELMRMFVARLVWQFDFVLGDESQEWLNDMEVYVWYKRPPLMCKLRPVHCNSTGRATS